MFHVKHFVVAGLLAVLLTVCAVQAGGQAAMRPKCKGQCAELRATWSTRGRLVVLRLDYSLENQTGKDWAVTFRNSGRVCGVLRDSKGKALHRFPEITMPVLATEKIAAGERRRFSYEVPLRALGRNAPSPWQVEAWLCDHETLRAQTSVLLLPHKLVN